MSLEFRIEFGMDSTFIQVMTPTGVQQFIAPVGVKDTAEQTADFISELLKIYIRKALVQS